MVLIKTKLNFKFSLSLFVVVFKNINLNIFSCKYFLYIKRHLILHSICEKGIN